MKKQVFFYAILLCTFSILAIKVKATSGKENKLSKINSDSSKYKPEHFLKYTKIKDTILFYKSGMGDLFTITKDSIFYTPVRYLEFDKPRKYSGGDKWAKPLTKNEYYAFVQLFITALNDRANHLSKTVKPHPTITIHTGKKVKRFILERNAAINIDINSALNLLRK